MCKFSNGKSLILQLSLCGSSCLWRVFKNLFWVLLLTMPEFWPCQSCQYTQVLNIPGFSVWLWFWIFQGSEYFSFTQSSENAWIYLNNSWKGSNMSEYAGICANISKWTWIGFILHFLIVIHCLLEQVVIYFNVHKKLGTWKCLLEETNFHFFYSSWKYVVFSCFRLKNFTSKILNLLLRLRAEDREP